MVEGEDGLGGPSNDGGCRVTIGSMGAVDREGTVESDDEVGERAIDACRIES